MLRYWLMFGLIALCMLTYQDYKNKMRVDDRKNYFMMGVSICLMTFINRSLWYLLALITITLIMSFLLSKFKVIGQGDINSLGWIFYGYGLLDPSVLLWFFIFFSITTAIYQFFKLVVFKYKKPTPFFFVILINFIFTSWFFGLFDIAFNGL